VDDEPSICQILKKRLSVAGFEVAIAADGLEALDRFTVEGPDLAVLDVMLPKLDGLGVCQELRKKNGYPDYYPVRFRRSGGPDCWLAVWSG